jgi:hypothetical protein
MYIADREHVAYFCEEGTEGDDWNDRFRAYNAGPPYTWVTRVLFWAPSLEFAPDDMSVDAVNAGASPWLLYYDTNHFLHAHCSVDEFREFIEDIGGQSFVMEEK